MEQHIQFLKSVEGSVSDRNLSGNTLVHVPFLEETLTKAAKRSNEIVSAKRGELKRIFRNIDDIIALKVFSSKEFDHQMNQAEKERKDTLDQVHELDYYLVNEYQKSQPAESYTKLLFKQLLESSRKDGSISPINFDSKAYHNSEIYQVKEHRFISKEEFESINHKLAYKAQIIDEYEKFGKGLKELEERLTINVERNQLAHAGAYNGYVESNLNIEKSVDPIRMEKKVADNSKPAVNKGTDKYNTGTMKHIYHGEINKRGKAVGYHHESMMGGKIIPGTEKVPDKNGVYVAKVEIDGVRKVADSSFFPKEWNRVDVLKAIDEAYQTKQQISSNKYRGVTSSGIKIEMYLNRDGSIATVYPLYKK